MPGRDDSRATMMEAATRRRKVRIAPDDLMERDRGSPFPSSLSFPFVSATSPSWLKQLRQSCFRFISWANLPISASIRSASPIFQTRRLPLPRQWGQALCVGKSSLKGFLPKPAPSNFPVVTAFANRRKSSSEEPFLKPNIFYPLSQDIFFFLYLEAVL